MSKRIKLEPDEGEAPIEIVDLDAAIQADTLTAAESESGVSFWFCQIGTIKLSDGTSYHVKTNRAFITDPSLIEKLKVAAENPANHIIIE